MNTVSPPKTLILGSFAVMIAVVTSTLLFGRTTLPPAIEIDTVGQPTLGYPHALVHVVVFEEPKCPECARFSTSVYPKLKKNFIDSNKILYTVIPVSFISNSMPAAIALLCAFNKDPHYPNSSLFFKFLDYMYANLPPENIDWATVEHLQEMAKNASPAIDLDKLKDCIEYESYRTQIAKNTDYGASIMNGRLSTPSIYVNGIRAEEISEKYLTDLINEVLEQKGRQ